MFFFHTPDKMNIARDNTINWSVEYRGSEKGISNSVDRIIVFLVQVPFRGILPTLRACLGREAFRCSC